MIPYIKGKIPPHINAASIVYDRYNKRVLLFGGRVRELWAFNIKENQWDKVRTRGDNPPKLAYPSVVYDEKNKKMIVFGGLLDGTHNSSDQTWEYDVVKNSWQLIDAKGPSPRFAAAAAYDSKNGVMVLFGGRWKAKNGKRHALSDTWVYDPTFKKWIEIKTGSHPPNNKTYQAAYDKVNNVVVLLDNKSQTWVFRYKN
jgi:N-acetylneuraminic acid mutarotase